MGGGFQKNPVVGGRVEALLVRQRRRSSPGVVSAVRLDEVHVSVFGQEGHQLVVGPEMEGKDWVRLGVMRQDCSNTAAFLFRLFCFLLM